MDEITSLIYSLNELEKQSGTAKGMSRGERDKLLESAAERIARLAGIPAKPPVPRHYSASHQPPVDEHTTWSSALGALDDMVVGKESRRRPPGSTSKESARDLTDKVDWTSSHSGTSQFTPSKRLYMQAMRHEGGASSERPSRGSPGSLPGRAAGAGKPSEQSPSKQQSPNSSSNRNGESQRDMHQRSSALPYGRVRSPRYGRASSGTGVGVHRGGTGGNHRNKTSSPLSHERTSASAGSSTGSAGKGEGMGTAAGTGTSTSTPSGVRWAGSPPAEPAPRRRFRFGDTPTGRGGAPGGYLSPEGLPPGDGGVMTPGEDKPLSLVSTPHTSRHTSPQLGKGASLRSLGGAAHQFSGTMRSIASVDIIASPGGGTKLPPATPAMHQLHRDEPTGQEGSPRPSNEPSLGLSPGSPQRAVQDLLDQAGNSTSALKHIARTSAMRAAEALQAAVREKNAAIRARSHAAALATELIKLKEEAATGRPSSSAPDQSSRDLPNPEGEARFLATPPPGRGGVQRNENSSNDRESRIGGGAGTGPAVGYAHSHQSRVGGAATDAEAERIPTHDDDDNTNDDDASGAIREQLSREHARRVEAEARAGMLQDQLERVGRRAEEAAAGLRESNLRLQQKVQSLSEMVRGLQAEVGALRGGAAEEEDKGQSLAGPFDDSDDVARSHRQQQQQGSGEGDDMEGRQGHRLGGGHEDEQDEEGDLDQELERSEQEETGPEQEQVQGQEQGQGGSRPPSPMVLQRPAPGSHSSHRPHRPGKAGRKRKKGGSAGASRGARRLPAAEPQTRRPSPPRVQHQPKQQLAPPDQGHAAGSGVTSGQGAGPQSSAGPAGGSSARHPRKSWMVAAAPVPQRGAQGQVVVPRRQSVAQLRGRFED